METLTVLEGEGEAWLADQNDTVNLRTGTTLVFPQRLRHGLGAIGDKPLITLGVHASPTRIVNVHSDRRAVSAPTVFLEDAIMSAE
jgi:quercetin dioxygenase-like cupin family protein